MIVRMAPPEHLDWICERAQLTPSPGLRAIEALDAAGRIAGMVAYDGWTPNACTMHVAIEHPGAVRALLKQAFRIPFLELGREVVVGMVLSTNERALAFDRHLGFRELMRGRDWWAKGVDLVWFEMRREDCRWIPQLERKVA